MCPFSSEPLGRFSHLDRRARRGVLERWLDLPRGANWSRSAGATPSPQAGNVPGYPHRRVPRPRRGATSRTIEGCHTFPSPCILTCLPHFAWHRRWRSATLRVGCGRQIWRPPFTAHDGGGSPIRSSISPSHWPAIARNASACSPRHAPISRSRPPTPSSLAGRPRSYGDSPASTAMTCTPPCAHHTALRGGRVFEA